MALEVDTVIDRRRMARRVRVWRGLAILAVIGAVAGVALTQFSIGKKHIARVDVQGAIFGDRALLRLIDRLGTSASVAAVVVSINSPGGTAVAGERLYNALRRLDAKKPVVAHIKTIGASAAYMTALASDHIVAQRTSLTGSIGVLIQYGQISQLLDNIGVKISKVDSGPLKAEPNPFEPTSPAAVAALQSVVDDTFEYFLGLVMERRDMERGRAERLADGRIYTGAQALADGLIDEIGGEDRAVNWLVAERGVDQGLNIRDYEPASGNNVPFLSRLTSYAFERVLGALGVTIPPQFPIGSVDGLWSIWQAPHSP